MSRRYYLAGLPGGLCEVFPDLQPGAVVRVPAGARLEFVDVAEWAPEEGDLWHKALPFDRTAEAEPL